MSQPAKLNAAATRHAVVMLLCAHLLAVVLLAASPRLHHWVHPDDHADDHDCAVVVFLHGGSDSAPPPFIAPVCPGEWTFVIQIPARSVWIASIFAASHILEHAPPLRAVCPSSESIS